MSFSNGRPNGDWRMMPPPPRPSQPRGGGGGGGRGFISRGGNHGAGGAFRHNNNNHRYQDRIMPPPMNRHNNANVTRNIRWIPPPNHRNGSPHQQHNHRKRDGPFEGGGNYHHHQQRKRHCPLSRLKDNNSSAAASNNGTNAPATMPPPMRIKTESNRTNQTVTQRQGNHNRNHQRSNGRSSYTNNNAFMALAAPYRVKVEQRETNSSRTMTTNATATTNPAVRQEEEKKEEDPEIVDLVDSDEDEEERNPQAINSSRTHIIFTIDFSGSMNTKDVATKDQGKVRRYDAVFECIKGFLEEQLAASNDNDNNSSQAVVSVLIFNQQAQTLLNRMPLVGDGQKVLKALRTAQKLHDKPKGGTGFSAGFQRAKELAAADTVGTNVMVVFLSDGRPGDLKKSPPDANIPMQNTYRSHKKEYPAAGQHIEAMKQLHGGRFSLQLICLFDEGKPWLQYLSERYNATFHKPDLTMDDDEVQGMQQPPASTSDGRNNDSNDNDDGEDSEDEVMDMVVKSQDTLIQERHNRALAAGNVHSLLTSTATGTSIRSTFQSISSTVTAMRGGTSRLQERKVEIRDVSLMKEFTATRMILDADHDKITKAPGEEVDGRRVKIAVQPFAQGGLRNVYRMKQYGVQRQVAKESRHDISDRDRLRFHFEAAKCHARAKVYADAFNERVKRLKLSVSRIQFLPAEVYRLRDSSFPRGFRYLAVENEMRGKDHQYRKWNGNNGYVNPSNSDPCLVAQAFSHFSFENGSHNEMVVDIQGDCYQYTDPQLHSKDKHFGRADRGESGFKDFFKTHRCNHICKGLGLKEEALSSL